MAINVDAVFFACRAAIRPMRAQGGGGRRQAGHRVALLQVPPALGEIVARITQQLERGGLAGRGFGGVLGDALGEHTQLTGMTDVLFVIGGLGVEVREVGEQQRGARV